MQSLFWNVFSCCCFWILAARASILYGTGGWGHDFQYVDWVWGKDCLSGKDVAHAARSVTVCGFWRYKAYADIRRGSIAGEVVSIECAVFENASFLFRSLLSSYKVPHWLYISKFTRLRAVSPATARLLFCVEVDLVSMGRQSTALTASAGTRWTTDVEGRAACLVLLCPFLSCEAERRIVIQLSATTKDHGYSLSSNTMTQQRLISCHCLIDDQEVLGILSISSIAAEFAE